MLPSQLRATGLNRTNATDSSSTLGLLPLHPVALTEIIVPSISDATCPAISGEKKGAKKNSVLAECHKKWPISYMQTEQQSAG